MRQVIEAYALILTVALLSILAIAFTSINLNIVQARRIYNDVRAEVQASNGAIVPVSGKYTCDESFLKPTFTDTHHYGFTYTITREQLTDHGIADEDETFIYNSIYKINFIYVYSVPIFGAQYYPITGYVS